MKRSTLGAAIAATLAAAPTAQAAEPAWSGRVGVATWPGNAYGVVFDVPTGPVRLRGDLGWMHQTLGLGIGAEWPFAIPTGSLGPVLAIMQAPVPHAAQRADGSDIYSTGPAAPLLGVSYRWSDGTRWVIVSPSISVFPHFTLLPPPQLTYAWPSGLAWLEVGYRLAPSLDVSLRSAAMPVVLSWRFGGAGDGGAR